MPDTANFFQQRAPNGAIVGGHPTADTTTTWGGGAYSNAMIGYAKQQLSNPSLSAEQKQHYQSTVAAVNGDGTAYQKALSQVPRGGGTVTGGWGGGGGGGGGGGNGAAAGGGGNGAAAGGGGNGGAQKPQIRRTDALAEHDDNARTDMGSLSNPITELNEARQGNPNPTPGDHSWDPHPPGNTKQAVGDHSWNPAPGEIGFTPEGAKGAWDPGTGKYVAFNEGDLRKAPDGSIWSYDAEGGVGQLVSKSADLRPVRQGTPWQINDRPDGQQEAVQDPSTGRWLTTPTPNAIITNRTTAPARVALARDLAARGIPLERMMRLVQGAGASLSRPQPEGSAANLTQVPAAAATSFNPYDSPSVAADKRQRNQQAASAWNLENVAGYGAPTFNPYDSPDTAAQKHQDNQRAAYAWNLEQVPGITPPNPPNPPNPPAAAPPPTPPALPMPPRRALSQAGQLRPRPRGSSAHLAPVAPAQGHPSPMIGGNSAVPQSSPSTAPQNASPPVPLGSARDTGPLSASQSLGIIETPFRQQNGASADRRPIPSARPLQAGIAGPYGIPLHQLHAALLAAHQARPRKPSLRQPAFPEDDYATYSGFPETNPSLYN